MSEIIEEEWITPKNIKKIEDHLNECFNKEHCLLCQDCYAYATSFTDNHIRNTTMFIKFLQVTMSKEYNRCPRVIFTSLEIQLFAIWLQQNEKNRIEVHSHAEFGTGKGRTDGHSH